MAKYWGAELESISATRLNLLYLPLFAIVQVANSAPAVNVEFLYAHPSKLFWKFQGPCAIEIDVPKIKIEEINRNSIEHENFESKVETVKREQKEFEHKQRESILTNRFINQAKDLFNTDIGKIILNDKDD